MATRAVIYTRVSRDHQEIDGTSLDTQKAACDRYCADHGYQVIAYFTDTHTGAQWRERPGLTALRERLHAGGVDVVVSYDLDRLSRHQAHLYIIAEEVENHAARLEFVTESFEDSAVGRFIRSARAFAAEVEREKITERTTRGRRARVQSGRLIPASKPLYGYRWADESRSSLIIDPVESLVVRRIYDDALAGKSLRKISQELYEDQIPTPTGKPVWNIRIISQLLRHPNYTGVAYGWWRREEVGEFNTAEAVPLPPGTVPALVTSREQEMVLEKLKLNKKFAARNSSDPQFALLRGLVRCGLCDRSLSANLAGSSKGNNRYPCYQCNASSMRPDIKHTNVTISIRKLDTLVWSKVKGFLTQPAIVQQHLRQQQSMTDTTAAAVATLDSALADIERRTGNLVQTISLLDDPTPVVSELNQLHTRRQLLEKERQGLLASSREISIVSAQVLELWEWCTAAAANLDSLTYTERRDILFTLGITARLYPLRATPRVIVTAKLTPDVPIVLP